MVYKNTIDSIISVPIFVDEHRVKSHGIELLYQCSDRLVMEYIMDIPKDWKICCDYVFFGEGSLTSNPYFYRLIMQNYNSVFGLEQSINKFDHDLNLNNRFILELYNICLYKHALIMRVSLIDKTHYMNKLEGFCIMAHDADSDINHICQDYVRYYPIRELNIKTRRLNGVLRERY